MRGRQRPGHAVLLLASLMLAAIAPKAVAAAPAGVIIMAAEVAISPLAEVIERRGGTRRIILQPATALQSGSSLLFRSNLTAAQRRSPAVVVAVPPSVELTGVSGPVAVSVDHGRNFVPLTRAMVRHGGRRRAARLGDITHLRWDAAAYGGQLPGSIIFRGTII